MTRIDHTNCSHDVTPAGRKSCRTRRADAIREAQAAFRKAWDTNASWEIREYEAMVDLFAMRYGMTMTEAFDLIENGPCVY